MTLVVLEIEQKRPVNNSSQNGSRDQQFCMKIDLALLIPTIYITHIIQKWHLEQNGSQVKSDITKVCPPEAKQIYTRQFNIGFVLPSR